MGFQVPQGPPRPGDRGPDVIAVAVVGLVLSGVAVALRFWSRFQAKQIRWWWDDWFILLTVVFSYAFLILNIYWTTVGLGRHIESVPLSAVKPSIYISHACITTYAVMIWLIKMSAILFFARVFRPDRSYIRALWVVGGFVTAWMVCTAVVPWFNCSPVSKGLDPSIPGICFDRMAWYRTSAFLNFFFDLVILLLPLPPIYKLKMNMKQKVSICLVFLFGYSSAFLSFARFIIIILDPKVMSIEPSADPYWHAIPMLLLSMLEAPLAIVAICGPMIGKLISRAWKGRKFSSILNFSRFGTEDRPNRSKGSNIDMDPRLTADDRSSAHGPRDYRHGSTATMEKVSSERSWLA